MLTKTYDVCGNLIYWTSGDCDRHKLKHAFDAHDLKGLVPYYRNNESVLAEACRVFCGASLKERGKYRVDSLLTTADGMAIVEVVKGHTENEYRTFCTAKVDEAGVITSSHPMVARELQPIYQRLWDVCPATHVTQAMVRALEKMGGFVLRKHGGLYWLPNEARQRWLDLEVDIVAAGINGEETKIVCVKMEMDERAVSAVHDAVVGEIKSEAERIVKEAMSGDLGKRALQSLQKQADDLLAKIRPLDHILGDTMIALKASLDNATDAAGAAMIQLEAQAAAA